MTGALAYERRQTGDLRALEWRTLDTTWRGPTHEPIRRRLAGSERGWVDEAGAAREDVVAISPGPRSATGYRVEVLSVTERRGRIDVVVREHTPDVGADVRAEVTFPVAVIAIPKRDKPLRVRYEGR